MKILLSFLLYFSISASFGGVFTTYTTTNGLLNNTVNCIEKGSEFIWAGTNKGINSIVFEGINPIKFSSRKTSVPVLCLEDDADIIWVGLKGKGVYKMPKKNYKFLGFRKDVLGNKTILSIKKDGRSIEITTSEGKKYTFQTGKRAYKKETIIPPLNEIKFVAKKKTIELHNGILSRYNAANKSYKNFNQKITPTQGIKFNEGYLMATNKGMVYYSPKEDTIVFGSPALSLSNFTLNGKDTTVNSLNLGWDEYVFKYAFSFTELGDKEHIKLIYHLTGAINRSDTVDANEGLQLKDLEYGSYQLTITAENNLSVKAKNELTYSFSIENPLNDSIWEYLFYALILLIWTIFIIVIVKGKYKNNIRILEDALLEKTNRLNKIELGKYGLVEEQKVKV
jgi:hypothetical protein